MSGTLRLRGATSGYSELQAPAVAADQTFVLPTAGGTLLTTDSPVPKLTLELGSASQPSLTFEGDTDTGLYSSGTNTLNLVTGGSDRLVIDSSGRLLVGTTSTSTASRLILQGLSNNSAAGAFIHLQRGNLPASSGSPTGSIIFADNSSNEGARINTASEAAWTSGVSHPGRLVFLTTSAGASSSTERMRIDSSGNVGIGTTSPSYPLSVKTTTSGGQDILDLDNLSAPSSYGGLRVSLGKTDRECRFTATYGDSFFTFYNGTTSSEKLRIDPAGRLLVGTSSTSKTVRSVFQGNSSGAADEPAVAIFAANTATPTGGLGLLRFSDNAHGYSAEIGSYRDGGTWTSGSSQPSRLVFSTTADGSSSPTERLRITQAGHLQFTGSNIYIHQTTTNQPGVGNTTTGAAFNANGVLSVSIDNGVPFRANRNTDGKAQTWRHSGNEVAYVRVTASNATFDAGVGGTFTSTSDHRAKENIFPITDAITRLNELKPCKFNFIVKPDQKFDGFLAHEAQTVVPECVTGTKDEVDADGNPVYQGIDQSKLVPLLTAALQEALAKIETLEANNLSLENRIAALENN